ncbi:MAG: histidinol-phosphate transaminase [Melioribacteraceae bacterium]|nr:histidinol-phosphate transaminase [Melioribacteraceae bacterium]
MIDKLVRKNILKLKPYTSARGSYLEGILMDANENSLGSVFKDENKLELNRYPDPNQNKLREKLSAYLGVSSSKLFFGVGSDEIIDLLIRIFCEPKKDSVLIPQPTYGMYQVACEINDVKVIEVPLGKGFQLDVNNTLKAVQKNSKIIFLCSPNNPTGNLLTRKSILEILNKFKGIVVVDEAYIDFSEKNSSIKLLDKYENLVITRTFSKAWGLAGLRCGYSIANESITNLLFKVKAPYNMNKLTASAVLEALSNTKQKDNFVKKLNLEKDFLIEEMKQIKQIEKILPTDANFITFRINNATEIYTKLVKEGVIIRNRSTQLNLDNCLRVSIGTRKENKIFIKKLKEII